MPQISLPSSEQMAQIVAPKKQAILQNAASAVDTGLAFDVEGYSSVTFIVTGTFDAEIWFIGKSRDTSGGTIGLPNVLEETTQTFLVNSKTKNVGVFHVNVSGIKNVYARIEKYTSGNVTVSAVALKVPNVLIQTKSLDLQIQELKAIKGVAAQRPRNVELARAVPLTVQPGSYAQLSTQMIDISNYPIQYATINANVAHKFRLGIYYHTTPPTSLGTSTIPDFTIIDSVGEKRLMSEWIEARGVLVNAYVYNNDMVAHTYDVFLYGVG